MAYLGAAEPTIAEANAIFAKGVADQKAANAYSSRDWLMTSAAFMAVWLLFFRKK